jgi:hypothetical protein
VLSLAAARRFAWPKSTRSIDAFSRDEFRLQQNRNKISTAHLGSDIDEEEPYVLGFAPRSSDLGSTVEVDFLGNGPPSPGSSGSLTVSGGASFSTTAATCLSSSVTAAVGDIVRGTASFRVKT